MISGVGLLLLTITNRLGRVVDRTRQLAAGWHDCQLPDNSSSVYNEPDRNRLESNRILLIDNIHIFFAAVLNLFL